MPSEDRLSIGSTPANETCEQIGTPEYNQGLAIAECRAFAEQIKRELGEPPEGARLAVIGQSHDFGTYHEVFVVYDEDNQAAIEYAYNVEANAPTEWDATASAVLATCRKR